MTTLTRKLHTVQYVEQLDMPAGHPPTHCLIVDNRSCWVRDYGTSRYESGSPGSGQIHTVWTNQGKVTECDCPDRKYRRGECRHMAAVTEVVRRW